MSMCKLSSVIGIREGDGKSFDSYQYTCMHTFADLTKDFQFVLQFNKCLRLHNNILNVHLFRCSFFYFVLMFVSVFVEYLIRTEFV